MNTMSRSLLVRGLVVLVSTTGLIVGCSGSSNPEGDIPLGKVAQPGDMERIQKDIIAKKVGEGKAPKRPPGVTLPPR